MERVNLKKEILKESATFVDDKTGNQPPKIQREKIKPKSKQHVDVLAMEAKIEQMQHDPNVTPEELQKAIQNNIVSKTFKDVAKLKPNEVIKEPTNIKISSIEQSKTNIKKLRNKKVTNGVLLLWNSINYKQIFAYFISKEIWNNKKLQDILILVNGKYMGNPVNSLEIDDALRGIYDLFSDNEETCSGYFSKEDGLNCILKDMEIKFPIEKKVDKVFCCGSLL